MRLIKGLAEKQLLTRIRRFDRLAALGERGLGFYLLDFHVRGLFRKHGFASTVQFANVRLQLNRKRVYELLRIARALDELPLIDSVFAKGEITWSAVRELTRVAVRETEDEWLELASKSTLRQIERAVSGTERGERPPKDPYTLSRTRLKVVAELTAEDHAVWQTAFDRIAARCGPELDASTALVEMARAFLEQPFTEKEADARQAFQVVYHRCTDCERAWMMSGDGPQGVDASKVDARAQGAEVVRLPVLRAPRGDGSTNSIFLSTPGSPPVPSRERDRPNTVALRRHVLNRDGRCCAVPGCSNKGHLASHHIIWREQGGATSEHNEVSVCRTCHSLIHEGFLFVTGRAPDGLRWFGPDGKPIDRAALQDALDEPGDLKEVELSACETSPRGDKSSGSRATPRETGRS